MENIDWSVILAAVGGVVVALIAGFYAGFRKSVKDDGVQDWKDEVVKSIDSLAKKVDEGNKSE